jgi:CP family cyanate transporter-like MFS transporter
MVALLAAMSIPISMAVPMVAQSHHRVLLAGLTACYVTAYVGLATAPAGGAWVWMVFAGIGAGTFPLVLTMIGLHAHTAEATASLSAFTQSIGYILAGTGPLLFGVLHGVTGGWGVPIALLFVATTLTFVSGWVVAAPSYVEDELAHRSSR